jgi:hypothetical protein
MYSRDEIMQMDTATLWSALKILMEEETEDGEKLNKQYIEEMRGIQEGVDLKIPIWYITNKWYEIYPSTGNVKILGYGKAEIRDFMKEKEGRDAMMRKILIDQIEDDSITIPRVR